MGFIYRREDIRSYGQAETEIKRRRTSSRVVRICLQAKYSVAGEIGMAAILAGRRHPDIDRIGDGGLPDPSNETHCQSGHFVTDPRRRSMGNRSHIHEDSNDFHGSPPCNTD